MLQKFLCLATSISLILYNYFNNSTITFLTCIQLKFISFSKISFPCTFWDIVTYRLNFLMTTTYNLLI